jgi:dGTPase
LAEHPGLSKKPRRVLYETIRRMLSDQVYDVIDTTRQAVAQAGVCTLAEARLAGPLVAFSAEMKSRSSELKKFLFAQLYRHPQVMQTTGQAQQAVHELFSAYIAKPDEMPADFAANADLHRSVADYIAGMTDRFALREHERLTGCKLL